MTWVQAITPLLSAVLGAVVGGFVVHIFTLRREASSVRRAQRIAFLLEAYRRLLGASNRASITAKWRDDLESAIDDIMLLGEPEEIEAARRFVVEFEREGSGELYPVIVALRDRLRSELALGRVALPSPFNLRIVLPGASSGRGGGKCEL